MQEIARLKHRMPHPRNELRCTLFQKAAKYHGVSVGVAIIQRGYIRMRIDPDDSNVLVFPVQVIEEGKRHHTVAADGHDSVGVFCRKLPLRILNPRQDFVLGIDANCLPFLMSKFWDAFHNVEGTADDFLDRYAALPSAARNSAGVRPPSASLRLSVL